MPEAMVEICDLHKRFRKPSPLPFGDRVRRALMCFGEST